MLRVLFMKLLGRLRVTVFMIVVTLDRTTELDVYQYVYEVEKFYLLRIFAL